DPCGATTAFRCDVAQPPRGSVLPGDALHHVSRHLVATVQGDVGLGDDAADGAVLDRKSTRLNSSHVKISYAVFCLKKKNTIYTNLGIAIHLMTLFFAIS